MTLAEALVCCVDVAVDIPRPQLFTFLWVGGETPMPGARLIVPWGPRLRRVAVLMEVRYLSREEYVNLGLQLKPVLFVDGACPLLPPLMLQLLRFVARYYQHPIGPTVMDVLPKRYKNPEVFHADWLPRGGLDVLSALLFGKSAKVDGFTAALAPALNVEQKEVVKAILNQSEGFAAHLLFGVTGSGKTEVYLRCMEAALKRGQQVMLLLPEINLTPHVEKILHSRFAGYRLVILHSGVSELQRLRRWLACLHGQVDVVVATRLGVFAPCDRLGLIVVDEEHDASYKQQEGVRYSARDLAIKRAQLSSCQIILGSATPSLETWYRANQGQYKLHRLASRAVGSGTLPQMEIVSLRNNPLNHGFAQPAIEAIRACIADGNQAIVFLNRRGYAPVLSCSACGWLSACDHCSSYRVLHRGEGLLRCHHCSSVVHMPKACPSCGNVDLTPVGQGTQRIEEALAELLPNGTRFIRIDADSTRLKGGAETAFSKVHAGEIDVLIGTQMVAKGHDFERVQLVVVVNADQGLYAPSVRASEQLFAQLMQVAGRAGRHQSQGRVLIQTAFPEHPLFGALLNSSYEQFAQNELMSRQLAHMPPFSSQALLRANHLSMDEAIGFLQQAKEIAETLKFSEDEIVVKCVEKVWLADPVPLQVGRVAGVSRAQMLIESGDRKSLQDFISRWLESLWQLKTRVQWFMDVDPMDF